MPPKPADVPVGPALRAFRQRREYTIEQAAGRAKLHPVYFGDVERGKRNPTVRVLDQILSALQISWTEFGEAVDALRNDPSRPLGG